jgi:3-methyladenine DNA glycosylase/8-oxoguanine DNA glycosylase
MLTIGTTAPLDAPWIRGFLEPRLVPGLERLDSDRYERSLRLAGQPFVLALRFVEAGTKEVVLEASSKPGLPRRALELVVRDLFDLDANLDAFRRCLRPDPMMYALVKRRPGIRLIRYLDPFEGLVRAIVGQQVSVAAARTILGRLVERFGTRPQGHALAAFPTARRIRDARSTAIASVGLTRAKARSLRAVAEASLDGRLDWPRLREAPAAEAQATLAGLAGVGPWTASYVRMRVLGDRDAFPESDLGVVKACSRLMNRAELVPPSEVLAHAERWRPWRAYATLHLWTSLADRGPRDAGPRHRPARRRVGEGGRPYT